MTYDNLYLPESKTGSEKIKENLINLIK